MKSRSARSSFSLLAALSITIMLAGCVGTSQQGSTPRQGLANTPSSTPGQALYVTGHGGIAGFAISAVDGSLSPLPGSPFAPSLGIPVLQASPTSPVILGIAFFPETTIWVLRMDGKGVLQADPKPALKFSSFGFEARVPNVAFHASGKLLYLTNFVGPLVLSAHQFDESAGTIAPEASSQVQFPFTSCTGPFCDFTLLSVAGFSRGAGGEHAWVVFGACGFHVDCGEALDAMPVSDSGATIGAQADGDAIQSPANHLSGASIFDDGVVTLELMTCCGHTLVGSYVFHNGQLAAMAGCRNLNAPDPDCDDAQSIVMHPNQKLAILGGADGRLFTATCDAAGNLSLPVPTNISIATAAERLVLDQNGRFLYVTTSQQNRIFGFSIDANAGLLQAIPVLPGLFPVPAVRTVRSQSDCR